MKITAKLSDGYRGYLEIVYQLLYVTEPDRQCKYNLILRCVRVTVIVFVMQYVLHSVTVMKLQSSKMQSACSLLQFVACLFLSYFPLYLIHGTHFRRDLLNTKYVFLFPAIYVCKIFHSKKKSLRYFHKCTSELQ